MSTIRITVETDLSSAVSVVPLQDADGADRPESDVLKAIQTVAVSLYFLARRDIERDAGAIGDLWPGQAGVDLEQALGTGCADAKGFTG